MEPERTSSGGHLRSKQDDEAVARLAAEVRRIANDWVTASGGRLSETARLHGVAADMESLINPRAATYCDFPELSPSV